LLYLSLLATSAAGGNAVETLLSTDPVTEAERAFTSGDRRHIVVPVCGSQPGEAEQYNRTLLELELSAK
jgi:hypothetical protein